MDALSDIQVGDLLKYCSGSYDGHWEGLCLVLAIKASTVTVCFNNLYECLEGVKRDRLDERHKQLNLDAADFGSRYKRINKRKKKK